MRKKLVVILLGFVLGCVLVSEYGLTSMGGIWEDSESINDGWGEVQSGSWLSDWIYRKAHNITGSSAGVQVNYPMTINVHYDNGFDFEGDVYLDGKCRTDFGDIRFTDMGGNGLDYWMQEKVDSVHAFFWVEIDYIPEYPDYSTIYIYYGNANASTTSNKDWVLNLASGFEDRTTQDWIVSWGSHTERDNVSTLAYDGNYSRLAGRIYGSAYAGNGNFYDGFLNTIYLPAGSYRVEAAAMQGRQTDHVFPRGISLIANSLTVVSISSPNTQWHWLGGNFTLSTGGEIQCEVEFHVEILSASKATQYYYVDKIFVRKWCDPEPAYGGWGSEETSDDNTPPVITAVEWTPTSPYPYVSSNTTRANEPVLVTANVSEYESGMNRVELAYKTNNSEWFVTSMILNATTELWTSIIHGQSNSAVNVQFFITAYDNAGNSATSPTYNFNIESLILGDINGDGKVNMMDVGRVARNFGKESP